MKMKIPNSGSGNGYYGHEAIINNNSPYMSDASSSSSDDLSIDSPTLDGDFTEYMWMENEEEFEKQVMQQLEEEELMEQCMEAMLEDETEIRNLINSSGPLPEVIPASDVPFAMPGTSQEGYVILQCQNTHIGDEEVDISVHLQTLKVQDPQLVSQSTLNPNAQEFVPKQRTSLTVTKNLANGAS